MSSRSPELIDSIPKIEPFRIPSEKYYSNQNIIFFYELQRNALKNNLKHGFGCQKPASGFSEKSREKNQKTKILKNRKFPKNRKIKKKWKFWKSKIFKIENFQNFENKFWISYFFSKFQFLGDFQNFQNFWFFVENFENKMFGKYFSKWFLTKMKKYVWSRFFSTVWIMSLDP